MSNITNAQAIRFCNRNARPLADLIMRMDRTITQFLVNVQRDFESPCTDNASEDPIIDGATTANNVGEDGRPKVTKAEVAALKAVCQALKNAMDANSNRAAVRKWSTNDVPLY